MNAGRDVERLLTGWLVEEAAVRAPDRVLDSTRNRLNRTPQRRFIAGWREPMYITPLRLAGMAAVFAIAVLGAGYVGRVTAPAGGVGGEPSPAPTASASGGAATIAAFRAARNAVCARYVPQADALKAQLAGMYEPSLPAAQRAAKVLALRQIADQGDAFVAELAALDVPPALAQDHAANLTNYRDILSLIRHELDVLATGDLVAAEAIDLATDPIARSIYLYEQHYSLDDCP
jgi:hypothetical protein